MIAFWALLIWAVQASVRNTSRRPDHENSDGGARRIVDQRLAKAEIDAEEYNRLRHIIGKGENAPVGTGDRR